MTTTAPSIPDDNAWHVRGIPVTHQGPYTGVAGVMGLGHYGRTLECGLIMDVRWVPGPAPKGAPCERCLR